MRCRLLPSVLFGLALVAPATAELVNENLLTSLPSGFQVGYRGKNNDGLITELVPAGETVDNWTRMVTVQIFYRLKVGPEAFMQDIERRWMKSCPGAGKAEPITKRDENGYPTLVWLLNCPKNPATGKPEITWFKAVQGNDSFYVVQQAFRFVPSEEQIKQAVGYLKSVRVCDSRLADRACPVTRD